MKKKYIFFLVFTVLICSILIIGPYSIYNILPKSIKFALKEKIQKKYVNFDHSTKIVLRGLSLDPFKHLNSRYKRKNPKIENLDNDYNVKFLPETQYGNFSLTLHKVNFDNQENDSQSSYSSFNPFYIEIFEDHLILIDSKGKILKSSIDEIDNKNSIVIEKKFLISDLIPFKVMGTLIYNNYLFISYLTLNNKCQNYNISFAEMNLEKINFETFFTSNECGENLNAGRMQPYYFNGKEGILVTVGGEKLNFPTNKPQNINSIIGKIIFVDFNGNKTLISIGHRNPQGLVVDNENIISTEHGPKGGDEINKVIFGKNYGWPIASYGQHYPIGKQTDIKPYLKSHKDNNFEEPIYSFVPSIGISQIIKVPNTFSNLWEDNYLISSLNAGSLFRVKFDKDFKKIIYIERIFLNQRIRDLKYSKKNNAILLTLEDWQNLGVLKAVFE